MKTLKKLAPHAVILIGNMYYVFWGIDRVNKAMNFIDNSFTKLLLLLLIDFCFVNAYTLLPVLADKLGRTENPAPVFVRLGTLAINVLLAVIVLSTAALISIRVAIYRSEKKLEASRNEAITLEQENQALREDIDALGSRESIIEIAGKECVVIGRSNIVGKPMSMLLLHKNATVTICHSRTKDIASVCRNADIIVAAVGRRNFLTADMVNEGAVIVDVGINRDENGKVCGDVDFESAEKIAGAITPVPGGVGPMTITTLLENTLRAAQMAVSKK